MRAIRSITSTRTFTSMGTTTTSVWIVRSRSSSCTTLASVVFVNNRLQEVIVNLVRGGQACGKQRREVQEGFLTPVRFLGDSSRRAFWRQRPYRNLETLPNWIHDTDRTVTALGTTNDLQNGATKRMKRIVNLDVRIFHAQGIVSADVFILHLHCLVPAGGLSNDRSRWIHSSKRFFLPVRVLGSRFRNQILNLLGAAWRSGTLRLAGSVTHLRQAAAFGRLICN